MARRKITYRTAGRLIRLAYELEYLASCMRVEDHEVIGNGVAEIARRLGDIGRMLDRKMGEV